MEERTNGERAICLSKKSRLKTCEKYGFNMQY